MELGARSVDHLEATGSGGVRLLGASDTAVVLLPVVCNLACTQLGMTPAEALAACTVNAAHVLGRGDRLGRLDPGFAADLVLLDAPDWRYLAYHLGGDEVALVIEDGEVAWERG